MGIVMTAVLIAGCSGEPAETTELKPLVWECEEMVTEKTYKLWYDAPAKPNLSGFLQEALPLGNGYMGINVFGGTDTELISVTENSMFNPYLTAKENQVVDPGGEARTFYNNGGLNLLSKVYLDFGHKNVENYRRELSLNEAVARVKYDCEGVSYRREYFATYPDKVSVVRLTASQAGALTFTLRPEAVYTYDYMYEPGDGYSKTGTAKAKGDTVTVSGIMNYFGIRYEGLFKVIPQGGTLTTGKDTVTVENADSAIILMAVGTNYHMTEETFLASDQQKLNGNEDPHDKVQAILDAASAKTHMQLLEDHRADYCDLFGRADIDLGGALSDTVTTEELVKNYKKGIRDPYLEELVFQYGRYMLIASSREGCLPANLQGIWNFCDSSAWSSGYWHNINVQMNYWPAFNTDLAELFQSYVDYNETMRPAAQNNADTYLSKVGAENMAEAGTGGNGWAVGTGCNPYKCASPSVGSHSGPGTGAFTSLLFWDYYDFTRDETILEEHTYPAVEGMAEFLSKTLVKQGDGKWLVGKSASPENHTGYDDNTKKYLYYHTVGCAFDQQMVYENHRITLLAAQALGYTEKESPVLAVIREQMDLLDPVNIGYSGQVKEYREENYYSDIGDPNHRHISQLVGLYPGTSINSTTEAWLEAAATTLELRGDGSTGWATAHRALSWARVGDGENAYRLANKLLAQRANANLWFSYNGVKDSPFQIESNFGYTAAVAEMLLQSHEGCLALLPALPETWESGSFTGLTARGNFSVDAVWEKSQAVSFTVRSRAGSECVLRYPGIENALVLDSNGNEVAFETVESGLICFDTVKGETYTVKNIPAHTKIKAPENVTVSVAGGNGTLRWTESGEADSYNVYIAIGDEAVYTLLQKDAQGGAYSFVKKQYAGKRVTFRVTAVAADGTESAGSTIVLQP